MSRYTWPGGLVNQDSGPPLREHLQGPYSWEPDTNLHGRERDKALRGAQKPPQLLQIRRVPRIDVARPTNSLPLSLQCQYQLKNSLPTLAGDPPEPAYVPHRYRATYQQPQFQWRCLACSSGNINWKIVCQPSPEVHQSRRMSHIDVARPDRVVCFNETSPASMELKSSANLRK